MAAKYLLVLATLVLASSGLAIQDVGQTVTVSVFYESLCPDSQRFINEQLAVTWEDFNEGELVVELNPFGKANWSIAGNHYDFTCQHGDLECACNMAQACMLNILPDQKDLIPTIHCMMSNQPTFGEMCVEDDKIQDLRKCLHDEGESRLHKLGMETHGLEPVLTFVPWILFDGRFIQEDWENSLSNFKDVLCSKYLHNTDECKMYNIHKKNSIYA